MVEELGSGLERRRRCETSPGRSALKARPESGGAERR